jgi:hypothetical protein
MTPGAVVSASFLAALAAPAVWVLTLAGFLLRGGVVLLVAPVVVLPSAVGLANAFGPMLTTLVLGGPSPQIVLLLVAVVVGAFVWLLGGGWLAGLLEAEAIRRLAAEDAIERGHAAPAALPATAAAGQILAARLVAGLPLAVATAAGSLRLVELTYRELTLPSAYGAPLIVRVIRGAPDALFWIVVAWLVLEVWGALAARRIVLLGDGALPALGRAVVHALRRPATTVALAILPLATLLVVLIPSAVALSATWHAIRAELAGDAGALAVAGLVSLFVGLWGGALVLLGLVSAWRSATWTVEMAGTFGGVGHPLTGEWPAGSVPASMGDLRPHTAERDPR